MKRQTLVNGLLSLTAVSLITGCVDDKYDLTDIDTTSRFTVNDLTVPVNLSQIKLDNVINLDGNENITNDGKEYSIQKSGEINNTEFDLGTISVAAPYIKPTTIHIGLDGLPVRPGTYIHTSVELGPINIPASEMVNYEFKMDHVHKALEVLKNVKTKQPLKVEVVLSIPQELVGANNKISFQDLNLQLPWGLEVEESNDYTYYPDNGLLNVNTLTVNQDGKATLDIMAYGLELGEQKGTITNGQLTISGPVGVLGGKINLNVQNITLPNSLDIIANYSVSSFELKSFSGKINYNMDAINIAPISLSDLPDFLDNPDTKLFIANPQITVGIHNPIGTYNNGKNEAEKLIGKGSISLTSNFKNGISEERSSDLFELEGEESKFAFCTPEDGYTYIPFDGLRNVLTALKKNENPENYKGIGLPESIQVNIHDINFSGDVTDFPIGYIGSAWGNYEFNAPLGFGQWSSVVYETTEGDWGSEDIEKVNIKNLHLSALCSTDLPVSLDLSIIPVDKNGNEIAVKENKVFNVPAMSNNEPVELIIEAVNGGTISGFDGVKFKATVKQDANNTQALGPNLYIQLDNLRVTVDGYYQTDF